jgi:LytS/YehU family sensor histidine kinase
MISVVWLTISFSAILLFRYMQLRKENAEQAIERERLAKEREIEQRQFIETQKTELEKTVRERTLSLKHSLEELKFMQAQLIESEKMTSQMNPHFVFNSLNTIQSYIFNNDKKKANYYLGKFSDLMRKVLDNTSKPRIALAEEVELLRIYLDLEEARFAGEFSSNIEIDAAVDLEETEVPPMLIQPYAENALKHGLLHQVGPKELQIAVSLSPDGQYVEIAVSDNGIGRARSYEINRRRINHQSFATKANETRVEVFNRRFNKQITIRTIDKLSSDGSAGGTTVIIDIPKRG